MVFLTRKYMFATYLLDALTQQNTPLMKIKSRGKKLDIDQRRNLDRKVFSYYMQLINHNIQELVGHLADISSGGIKLDNPSPIPPDKDFRFRLDLTGKLPIRLKKIRRFRSQNYVDLRIGTRLALCHTNLGKQVIFERSRL